MADTLDKLSTRWQNFRRQEKAAQFCLDRATKSLEAVAAERLASETELLAALHKLGPGRGHHWRNLVLYAGAIGIGCLELSSPTKDEDLQS